MGRKAVKIDKEQVQALARLGCTWDEIADVLGVARSTLGKNMKTDKGVRDAYERGIAEGDVSIRRAQYDSAMQGKTAMLIWLGKNRLGQTDRIETKNETEITGGTGALEQLNSQLSRLAERSRQDRDSSNNNGGAS